MSSYTDWEKGIVNRNYFVLHELLKDSRVSKILSVDFLPFTFKKVMKSYLQNVIRGPREKVVYKDLTSKLIKLQTTQRTIPTSSGGAGQASYKLQAKDLFVYSTIDSVISQKRLTGKLEKIIKKLGLKNILLWSYNPLYPNLLTDIEASSRIFDTVDNWIEHPSYAKFKESLKNGYKTISEKADLVFTVSEELINFYKNLGREKDVYWIPNGVDVEHFNQQPIQRTILTSSGGAGQATNNQQLLKNVKHPVIGYIGTIEHRFDVSLVASIAQKNPKKSVVLIGPIWKDVQEEINKKLKKFPNIYFLGRKSYRDSPSYIHEFDVAIIPHKLDKFLAFTNPMKLYEYLACGKPVVATPGAGMEMFKDLVYIAKDPREFSEKINKALKEDSLELKEKRLEAVKKHSWKKRVEEMLKLIEEKF